MKNAKQKNLIMYVIENITFEESDEWNDMKKNTMV
jgi:hypothetical protein